MPLANTNGKTDWKYNISQWFQTDAFSLDPLMLGIASMPGCSRKVLVRNPAVSAALRGRAARGGGRRLPALRARCRRASPLPSRRRDRAAAARARGAPPEAERGGGGTRPRPFLSLPFPPRSPGLSRRRHGQCPRRAGLAVPPAGARRRGPLGSPRGPGPPGA